MAYVAPCGIYVACRLWIIDGQATPPERSSLSPVQPITTLALRRCGAANAATPPGEAVPKVRVFGQLGSAACTLLDSPIASRQAANTKPKNLDICLSPNQDARY